MRVKKMVAELAMERRRFSEETELLKSEISNFLCHYKDVIIPTLQSEEASLFTMSEKTSLFVVHPPDVVYVDSHCHAPDAGAAIVLGRCHRLKEFCHSVWDIEGARPDTYGNLVLLLD